MKAHIGSRLPSFVLALALAAPALRAQKTNVVADGKDTTNIKGALPADQSKDAIVDKGALSPDQSKMWAAQTSPNEIRLSWGHVTGAVSYTIACAIGSEPPRVMGTVAAPRGMIGAMVGAVQRVEFLVVARVAGAYDCLVRATDPKGAVSAPVHFNKVSTLEKAALTRLAPARVTATETGPNEITVTWTAVPGATAYFIGRAVSPAGFTTLCGLCSTTTTYVDHAVTPGARHTYTVGALTAKGAFPRTSSNTVTLGGVAGGTAPADSASTSSAGRVPTDVKAAFDDDSKSAVRVTWKPVAGATAYRVLRVVGGLATQIAQIELVSVVIRDATQVLAYVDRFVSSVLTSGAKQQVVSYRVVAVFTTDPDKALSEPGTSNDLVIEEKAAVTDANAVTYIPPRDAIATATGATSVRLTWTPAAGAATCDIERSSNGGAYTKIASRPGYIAQYTDATTDVPNLHPRYRITCGDPKGAAHSPVAFTVPIWDPKSANPKSGTN